MAESSEVIREAAIQKAIACFDQDDPVVFQRKSVQSLIHQLVLYQRKRMFQTAQAREEMRLALEAAKTMRRHLRALAEYAEPDSPYAQYFFPEGLDHFILTQELTLKSRRVVEPKTGSPTKPEKRFLAYQCAQMLREYGVRATTGKNGTIARLASAIHLAATGQEESFVYDASLVADEATAASALFKAAPPVRMSEEEVAALQRLGTGPFRKPRK